MKKPTTTIRQRLLAVTFVCGMLAFTTPASFSQDPAAGAVDEVAVETVEPPTREMTLFEMVRLGGWTMWFLGICSIAGIGLTIYNALTVRPSKLLNPAAVVAIRGSLENLDIQGARERCAAEPCMITNVVDAGLSRVISEIRMDSIEKGMEEAATEQIGQVLVPINYISVAAIIAPMLGLLGTVSGMISAFRAMALGGMGRPELLADNISEALITTATGLIIGIPLMISYLYFKNRFTSIVGSMNRVVGNLVETLNVAVRQAAHGYEPRPAAVAPEAEGEETDGQPADG